MDVRAAPGRKSSHGVDFESETTLKPCKIQKSRKYRNLPKTSGFIDFSMFKMHFRSADAANHLNARTQVKIRVTRRAYIPKIYKLEE